MSSQSAAGARVRWGRVLLISSALIAAGVGGLFLYRHLMKPPAAGPTPAPTPSEGASGGLAAVFDGADQDRPQVKIGLRAVGEPFKQPTDVQIAPDGTLIVLEKRGHAHWLDPKSGARGEWFNADVLTRSEQGLLGLAFHPKFAENGKLYLNMVVSAEGRPYTRIQQYSIPAGQPLRDHQPTPGPVILDVSQPYANHNAGQLAFGPDSYLYVGFGDGGLANDPHNHGQNPKTLLGAMIRVDVDHPGPDRPYSVPADNPFIGRPDHRPELWAIGLRNPWRYTFTPDGRLVAGDVGQNKWEEITFVPKGANLGWRLREADRCFIPQEGCPTEGLLDPIYTYSHEEGRSVTGGEIYGADAVPALKNHYIFGDYGSGRLWAMTLPAVGEAVKTVKTLGRWPINPVAFARTPAGEVYLADFTGGRILQVTGP